MGMQNKLCDEIFDLIVIGSGPAGESAVELASFFGFRCLVIEKNLPGGVVTTTGGVPTKTLREAAFYFTGFREREVYGLRGGSDPELVLDQIRDRTWDVSKTLQLTVLENFRKWGVSFVNGAARLVSDHDVNVRFSDGSHHVFTASIILIASGSRPAELGCDVPVEHPRVCNTDTILNCGYLPKNLLIVGGGPVAVEFATISRALAINVTIVSLSDRLLVDMDREIAVQFMAHMSAWDVAFIPNTTVTAVTPKGDDLLVTLRNGSSHLVDRILFAAGRRSNTEGLGLDAIGVNLDGKGRITVDKSYCTSVKNIFAAGDVIGPTLASVAMEQGRAAVFCAFDLPIAYKPDPTPVNAVYGMPEVARVGLTEDECIAGGVDYEVGRSDLGATPRGAIAGRGGLLKIIFAQDSKKILGVHCIGDIASEIIGIGQIAVSVGATLSALANLTLNTPTYSFAYKYAALDGLRKVFSKRTSSVDIPRNHLHMRGQNESQTTGSTHL